MAGLEPHTRELATPRVSNSSYPMFRLPPISLPCLVLVLASVAPAWRCDCRTPTWQNDFVEADLVSGQDHRIPAHIRRPSQRQNHRPVRSLDSLEGSGSNVRMDQHGRHTFRGSSTTARVSSAPAVSSHAIPSIPTGANRMGTTSGGLPRDPFPGCPWAF